MENTLAERKESKAQFECNRGKIDTSKARLTKCFTFETLSEELSSELTKLGTMSIKDVKAMLSDGSKVVELFGTLHEKFNMIDEVLLKICNIGGMKEGKIDIERLQEDYALFHAQLNHTLMSCLETVENEINKKEELTAEQLEKKDKFEKENSFFSLLHTECGKISGSERLHRFEPNHSRYIKDKTPWQRSI